jgi:hypothetical protein
MIVSKSIGIAGTSFQALAFDELHGVVVDAAFAADGVDGALQTPDHLNGTVTPYAADAVGLRFISEFITTMPITADHSYFLRLSVLPVDCTGSIAQPRFEIPGEC